MMLNLPKVTDFDVSGKRVIVRLDLDVNQDYSRLETAKETLDFLVRNKAKIIIIGHKGRPGGVSTDDLSLRSLAPILEQLIKTPVFFEEDAQIVLKENLRFDAREETNDENFAKEIASLGDFYVNEAFAVSHRSHASIVGIAKLLPHAAGLRFDQEVQNLEKVLQNPRKPVLVLISGIKKDKVQMAEDLLKIADKVLVGGRLPEYIREDIGSVRLQDQKMLIANLIQDKEDITINSIEKFKAEIAKAGTIVLAGVLGRYEDPGHIQGTKEIFTAVANSTAFKIAGGGDTINAINMFNLQDKFDWISVGGGAMLEFLTEGTLPGIEALTST